MQNIPIIKKFLTLMGMFAVFSIACVIYTTTQMSLIQKGYAAADDGPAAYATGAVRSNATVTTMRASILALLVANTDAERKEQMERYLAARKRFEGFTQQMITAAPDEVPQTRELAARVSKLLDQDCARTIALGQAAKTGTDLLAAQNVFNTECLPPFQSISDAFVARNGVAVAKNESIKKDLAAQTNMTIWVTYVLMLGGLVIVIGIGIFGIRAWLLKPLNGLVAVMNRLAQGDYNTRIDGAERRDEIGTMSRALDILKAAGLEKERLQAEAETQRGVADQERRQNEQARAVSAKSQAEVVNALGVLSQGLLERV